MPLNLHGALVILNTVFHGDAARNAERVSCKSTVDVLATIQNREQLDVGQRGNNEGLVNSGGELSGVVTFRRP